MSAPETPASTSAPCATSTISDSTSRSSCRPNLLCAQPTMHPVIRTSVLPARIVATGDAALYPDMGTERAFRMDTITLRRPDDWHVHLRDGAMLAAVVPFTARQFGRAIVMPNLVPPVTDVAAARAYRERIAAALPAGAEFVPLMTCYLTDATDPGELARGWDEGVFT